MLARPTDDDAITGHEGLLCQPRAGLPTGEGLHGISPGSSPEGPNANAFNDIKIQRFTTLRLGSRVAIRAGNYLGREEHPMQSPIRNVYEQFVAEHYAEKP